MWRVMETPLNCAEEQQPPPAFPASWSTVTPQESPADRNDKGNAVGFVLVHAGAGYHSESKAKEYKHVCKRACQRAVDRLKAGALAVDAVTAALVELEDSPFTNAGMGSNLNLSGEIECDASIMDGKSLRYGAVGAVSGINNPVLVANRLLSEAQKGKLSAGRIPPCFLVGRGAHDWAVNHGIPPCPSEKMATKFSLSAYKRNKHKMELAEKVDTGFNHHSKKRRQASETENGSGLLDTVGAIVVDREGNVAAAVSSGGLAMKHPGRVGQAAHHGCGCWAENTSTLNPYSTAVSTSDSHIPPASRGCSRTVAGHRGRSVSTCQYPNNSRLSHTHFPADHTHYPMGHTPSSKPPSAILKCNLNAPPPPPLPPHSSNTFGLF
ncbi:threonine aspartase 1 isoform X3 [Oncorhynchus tshawytscha]|uniref:Threonine aspartase 1 n=1 Tax=Oncorhynchus tshawytscha TaxID=74940 RepID=A0A8C8MD10_ONCTS|nr:threonine aspartase 1 isoform X3 [Oncorhynchus tshawytscha]